MTLSKTESVIFLYIEKRRLLLYEVSPFGALFYLLCRFGVFNEERGNFLIQCI